MQKITHYCDVCEIESGKTSKWIIIEDLQVIFTTYQEDGVSCEPYIDSAKVELCKNCHDYLMKGNYLFAAGAMGYNEYYFNR